MVKPPDEAVERGHARLAKVAGDRMFSTDDPQLGYLGSTTLLRKLAASMKPAAARRVDGAGYVTRQDNSVTPDGRVRFWDS